MAYPLWSVGVHPEENAGREPEGVAGMNRPRPQLSAAPDVRIAEIDILRGIALIGIYWINVVVFALPNGAYSLPHLLGEAESVNVAIWAFSEVFVEGTMRGLFSILFGASTLIFLDEAKLASHSGIEVVDRYYRRCLTLMLFGLIHAYFFLAQWDLLFAYGLLGMFLFPLRNLEPRALILVGLVLFAISDFNSWRENHEALQANAELRSMTPQQLSDWRQEMRQNNLDEMQTDIDTYRAGYSDIFAAQSVVVQEQQSSKMYTEHFFDIGGMMVFGMALMKLGVLTGQRSLALYVVMMLGGWVAGGIFRGLEAYELWAVDFNVDARDPDILLPYNIDRIVMTLGHIGFFGILLKLGLLKWASSALSAVGKLALTNYVSQTLLSVLLFYGFGLGYFAYLERYELIGVFFAVAALQVAWSQYWLQHFRMGPLEWLWRSMVYGKWQKLSRDARPEQAPTG